MRKKSAKKAAAVFEQAASGIEEFLERARRAGLSDEHITWLHDYAVIRLYREFEVLILECLVAAVNNDTSQLSKTTHVQFPKHLTDEVCSYLIVGDGFFDFRGRDGLIKRLRKYLPDTHYLLVIVKKDAFKAAIERVVALRNYAAHGSQVAKARALNTLEVKRLSSAGAWLKIQGRFEAIAQCLRQFAAEIAAIAPF